jgi:hypothetical protein
MSEYVHVIEKEDEDGIGVLKALGVLSANEHRNTSEWHLVEKQCFKNGRLDETHIYCESVYRQPDPYFEPAKMLVFEVQAIAKALIMEEVENQLREIREEDDEDED